MTAERPATARHVAAIAICALLGLAGLTHGIRIGGVVAWLLAAFLLVGASFLIAPRAGELALVAKLVAALVVCTALLIAAAFVGMESAEVVVLRYRDDHGDRQDARLWVIDLDGAPSVTTGSDTRRAALIRANPDVELVRDGRVECRRARVFAADAGTSEDRRTAERLYREKYGFRLHVSQSLRTFLGGAGAEPVLIRLEPCA